MNHIEVVLEFPKGSLALLADDPDRAVVFVHGFAGNSRSTWAHFHDLVDQIQDGLAWWSKCDLYFYRYRSRDQIKPLAEELRQFIANTVKPGLISPADQFQLPSGFLITTTPRKPRLYKRLTLVGHSTGAVVIREAVLQDLRNAMTISGVDSPPGLPPAPDTFLRTAVVGFFAPAHRGAMCSGWLGLALQAPLADTVLGLLLRSNPLFHNIREGSPVIEDIRNETERLFRQSPEISALTACSLFGQRDAIVHMGKYAHEPDIPTVPNQGHCSICKPSPGFMSPLKFLENLEAAFDAKRQRQAGA